MPTTRRRPPPPPPAWTPEPWSDGETSALLDAWGPRHLRAGGGPLWTVDWRACAAAVTARRAAGGRPPRTVDQCKNRMDYLKKRLRADRSRPRRPSLPPPLSGCLRRLRELLRQTPSVPAGFAARGGTTPWMKEEEEDDGDDDDYDYDVEDEEKSGGAPLPRDWPSVPKRPRTAVSLSPASSSAGYHHENQGAGCTEVAAALDRLAGMYERVETAKQREATRLEERRIEAMRELEIERMRVLVDVAVSASTSTGTDEASAASAGGGSGLVEELGQ